jgi:hypothetical protein
VTRHVTFLNVDDAETIHQSSAPRSSNPIHSTSVSLAQSAFQSLGPVEIVPVAEEPIRCDPIKLPRFWPRLGTVDFGWNHPSAAVDLAFETPKQT